MTDPRMPDADPLLLEHIARLPEEIPPARDLWPAIHARLEAERVAPFPAATTSVTRRQLPWALLAAAAVVLIVGTATATWLLLGTRQPAVMTAQRTPAPGQAEDGIASYERSAEELSLALARRSARLDASTRAVLERSLSTIDAAILEARAALARDPSNVGIRSFVEAAFRQKIDFLRRANDVASHWET